ncbi:hypothetical protein C8Q77DRAFT_356391 [Trametes polyzona]|nr:hypothetical protein C8Q77DRAFT_356391 [Trametes polyzona]
MQYPSACAPLYPLEHLPVPPVRVTEAAVVPNATTYPPSLDAFYQAPFPPTSILANPIDFATLNPGADGSFIVPPHHATPSHLGGGTNLDNFPGLWPVVYSPRPMDGFGPWLSPMVSFNQPSLSGPPVWGGMHPLHHDVGGGAMFTLPTDAGGSVANALSTADGLAVGDAPSAFGDAYGLHSYPTHQHF